MTRAILSAIILAVVVLLFTQFNQLAAFPPIYLFVWLPLCPSKWWGRESWYQLPNVLTAIVQIGSFCQASFFAAASGISKMFWESRSRLLLKSYSTALKPRKDP